MLQVMQEGFVRTMALTGCRTVGEIDRDLVHWRS
jgi:isopentenyl diphosphate isomerase/L-lactate dehydrogenase-like FMN-dependent dehydrogenase